MFVKTVMTKAPCTAAIRLTSVTVGVLTILLGAGIAHAKATIKVTPVTPPTLHITVDHNGRVLGNRNIVFSISRTDKPTGVFASCRKIQTVKMSVDTYLYKTITERDEDVGDLSFDPPLCSFSNRKLTTTPISDYEYRQVCKDMGGSGTKRVSHLYAVSFSDNSGYGIDDVNGDYGNKSRRFTAEVRCLGPLRGSPVRIKPAHAKCDFSGSWPVWLANGSQRQPIPFVSDGTSTVAVFRATPNGSRVDGHAFVREIRNRYQLIVNLHVTGHPETFATFNGWLNDWTCTEAAGEYYAHDGNRVIFESHYVMKRLQGNSAPVRSPVGRPTANTPPVWHPRQLPQIPNWRKRP